MGPISPLSGADLQRQRMTRVRGLRNLRRHFGEFFVTINAETNCLWRPADHEGQTLKSAATSERDKQALKYQGKAEIFVTDGLKSHPATMRERGSLGRRVMGRWLNNRAEYSHLPSRRRERVMLRFRQMKLIQMFALVRADVCNHVKKGRQTAVVEWKNLIA